jgi:hypothetical protein
MQSGSVIRNLIPRSEIIPRRNGRRDACCKVMCTFSRFSWSQGWGGMSLSGKTDGRLLLLCLCSKTTLLRARA